MKKKKQFTPNWTPEFIQYVQTLMLNPISLDQPKMSPADYDADVDFYDFLKSEEPSPEEVVNNIITRDILLKAIYQLPARMCEIVLLRFGIKDGKPRTLEEVGDQFHVTRERIRQIEVKALQKLRNMPELKDLANMGG